jgi:hypothetical protein
MLELLWVEDPGEAQSEQTAPTKLWERWSDRIAGACPFGIATRPVRNAEDDPPFPALEYRPSWLAPDLKIHISPAGLNEPMWLYMPFLREFDYRRHFVEHPNGAREITRLTLTARGPLRSAAAEACIRNAVVNSQLGSEHLLVMEFDHGSRRESTDFRPYLPLVIQR